MLRIHQVKDYLYSKYGVIRCTRGIRNWINMGLLVIDERVKLQVDRNSMGEQFTRRKWVDEFIEKVGER